MTSIAEKVAPNAKWAAGVPLKYRWCIVPTTPPIEYRMMSRYIDRVATSGAPLPATRTCTPP